MTRKNLINDLVRADVIRSEIDYAKTQLQPHDTGHIHTAIGWLEQRLDDINGVAPKDEYPDGYSAEWRRQQQDPKHNQSAFKGHR